MKTTKLVLLFCALFWIVGESTAAISTQPVTKDATEGATLLYKFLYDHFKKNTISGVMCGDMDNGASYKTQVDVAYLYSIDGNKYPALVGVDLLNATGAQSDEAWFKTYTQSGISLAKELWKDGGIPSFNWHWKVGSENAFYAKGANDSYTDFDYTKGFKAGTTEWDTSSETYRLLIADIDHVADLFLELQASGVAAIWRPLHEASGGWFWWGTKGAKSYVALYRLVYDRMVNVKGVKNLIWVWNLEKDPTQGYAYNEAWYPGDQYIDVIGVDIYNGANNTQSNINTWNTIISKMGSDKILALTENGPIVDPAEAQKNGDIWSWWMPWYNSWSGGFIDQTSASLWKSAMSSDLIITLDEMPGWGTYQEVEDPSCAESLKKNIYEAECSADYVASVESVNKVSGSGALNLKESTDYININIPLEKKGSYKVYVGYNSVYGFKQIDCAVNGVSGTANLGEDKDDESVDKMGETLVGTFEFSAGENVVKLTPIWTWAVVDYVRIEKDNDAPVYEFNVSDVDGFKVSGNKLLDRCDNEFVMRGVNLAYTWYKSSAYDQLKAIYNNKANAVRIVLTNGNAYGSPADDAASVKKLIDACKAYGMVAILEVHDVTGSDKISDLEGAAQYFANLASTLKGTEHYVIINIANEWHNSSSAANWKDGYVKAIPIIRKAGLRHCIMVDAGGYGQSAATIHTYGKDVLAADPENNVLFSIHMYGTAGNKNRVKSNIDGVINQGLALCIGEFGWYHSDGDVDEDQILSYCQEKNVGWLAWSWYGNGSPVEYLDLVKDASSTPTLATQSAEGNSCAWGKKIVDAWKAESKYAKLDTCPGTGLNDIASYGEKSMLYYAQAKNTLYVNTEEGGTLRIIDLKGTTIDTKHISPKESVISLEWLPKGLYIAHFEGLSVKIVR